MERGAERALIESGPVTNWKKFAPEGTTKEARRTARDTPLGKRLTALRERSLRPDGQLWRCRSEDARRAVVFHALPKPSAEDAAELGEGTALRVQKILDFVELDLGAKHQRPAFAALSWGLLRVGRQRVVVGPSPASRLAAFSALRAP